MMILFFLLLFSPSLISCSLPPSHHDKQFGLNDECWGHEPGCSPEKAASQIVCDVPKDPFSGKNKKEMFYGQADFGYVKNLFETFTTLCDPQEFEDSTLLCAKNLLYCRGRNLMIDFGDAHKEERSLKYQMDVLKPGQIGGKCRTFHRKRLAQNQDYMAPLQSWAPELRNFVDLDQNVSGDESELCDVVVERPTVVMKLDATVNLYHHFCDFFNLYTSLHLSSLFDKNSFSTDVNLLIWENQQYYSNFGSVFQAFTDHPLLNLNSFGSKKVCFRNIQFALLPRMFFGLFYNTPIVAGCEKSSLFKAFSEFLSHRLKLPPVLETNGESLRVTVLSRQTRHRRALNEKELVQALEDTGRYDVNVVHFTHRDDFLGQMATVHHTDILVGMHGAGLTHLLFLRDWAALFELHNCEDPNCYHDLARLRGVKYLTWSNESLVTQHYGEGGDEDADSDFSAKAKFINYSFDKEEFVRKVDEAASYVKSHEQFKKLDVSLKEKREEL